VYPLPAFQPGLVSRPSTALFAPLSVPQVEGMEEEDCWVMMCRALTGCMVFLSEEEQRQRAYKALQGVFALLHDHSRCATHSD
jgi:predicted RNase H-like HicB family nuclease